jgi:hypothetical protein
VSPSPAGSSAAGVGAAAGASIAKGAAKDGAASGPSGAAKGGGKDVAKEAKDGGRDAKDPGKDAKDAGKDGGTAGGAAPTVTKTVVTEGAWALHRFFDRMQLAQGAVPERLIATGSFDGRRVVLEVTVGSVENPLRLRQLEGFRCPSLR